MDNFIFNIQSIKSQIDNIKLQLSNIELQYNNMNGINQGEQLLNLSIQILNTGIQTFNSGKNHTMLSIDNYYNQLKNISNMINSLLGEYNNIQMTNQQMQQMMMYKQMQQEIFPNPMMQNQMMQQQMNNQISHEKKMNITFYEPTGNLIGFSFSYGTRIKEILDKFSERVGTQKFNYTFLFNGKKLNHDDDSKIEEKLNDLARITALKFG